MHLKNKGFVSKRKSHIFAGQVPKGERWVNTSWSLLGHQMPEISSSMKMALEAIDSYVQNSRIKSIPIEFMQWDYPWEVMAHGMQFNEDPISLPQLFPFVEVEEINQLQKISPSSHMGMAWRQGYGHKTKRSRT